MDGLELCGGTTAIALVLRMCCVGVRCHIGRSHLTTVYVCNAEESLGRSPAPQYQGNGNGCL